MSTCYSCGTDLTKQNTSTEHIILNAIGGRLKSRNLLCKNCNSKMGTEADAILADQLNPISNILDIERERGEPQSIKGKVKVGDEEYELKPGGEPILSKPKFRREKKGNREDISITARGEQELRDILKGIKKKYASDLNIEEAIQKADYQNYYLNDKIEFGHKIGGESAFRSICKTAVNFFIYKGGEREYIKHLIPYLKGGNDEVVWFYNTDESIHSLKEGEVSHVLYLQGDSKEQVLYCYIEFFNSYCFLVKLNTEYNGEDMEAVYCYDVLKKSELNKQIELSLTKVDLKQVFKNKEEYISFGNMEQYLGRVLAIAQNKQVRKHQGELVKKAMKKTLGEYNDNVQFDQEMFNEFVENLMEEIAPFIAHLLNSRRSS